MKNVIIFEELTYEMLVLISGGETLKAKALTEESSFAQDLGFFLGRILSAFGRGSSLMYG